jgi:hypothetical protein
MALQGEAKTAYMREYMRRRRAGMSAKPAATKPVTKPEPDRRDEEIARLKARIAELEAGHKAFMPRATFRKILACLHSDQGLSKKTMDEAFVSFKALERVLVNDEQERRQQERRSWREDMDRQAQETFKRRRQKEQERKARRAAASNKPHK